MRPADLGRNTTMRKLTLSGAFALVLLAGGTGSASAAPWCAWYDPYTYNCAFHTFQQCLDTISGVGGYCARNVREPADRPPPRRRYRDQY
jgi:Protein of unknown function (DUF3551)